MSIRQFAEIAGAEVLVFEITDERFFGFGDADMASAGAGIEVAATGSTGSTILNAAGLGDMQPLAGGLGSANLAAAGLGAMEFDIVAVEKKSADFLMAGLSSWMATGITFTPHSVLNEDAVRRPPEARALRRPNALDSSVRAADGRAAHRPAEIRGSRVLPQPTVERTEEQRELVR